MGTDADADVERTAVKTYVPAYQKERWRDHADELDMTTSEFVRTMVQAGRRGFGADVGPAEPEATSGAVEGTGETATAAADGGVDLEAAVVDALADGEPHSWDDLLAAAVPEDVEDALDETLQDLQDDGRVQHSGRLGGYTLTDDER